MVAGTEHQRGQHADEIDVELSRRLQRDALARLLRAVVRHAELCRPAAVVDEITRTAPEARRARAARVDEPGPASRGGMDRVSRSLDGDAMQELRVLRMD